MIRLFWKEWRERLWWGLVWSLSILGVSLFAHGQSFCGEHLIWLTPWPVLPLLLALLAGVGSYASETKRGRAEFLFARPISGGQVLAGKLLFGVSICFGMPLLAALIFRFTGDAPYQAHVTLTHALVGVWDIGWKMGAIYLFGLGCSPVVPGMFGGVMTLAVVSILGLVTGIGSLYCLDVVPSWYSPIPSYWYEIHLDCLPFVVIIAAYAAVLVAAWRLTRYGLTLDVGARLKRYTLRFLPVFAVIWLFGIFAPTHWLESGLFHWETEASTASPSGQYAYVVREQWINPLGLLHISENPSMREGYLVSLAREQRTREFPQPVEGIDLQRFRDPLMTFQNWQWMPDDTAYICTNDLIVINPGQKTSQRYAFSGGKVFYAEASPHGRYILVNLNSDLKNGKYAHSVTVVDLRTGRRSRRLDGQIGKDGNSYITAYWVSADTIEYRVPAPAAKEGVKRTVPVKELFR